MNLDQHLELPAREMTPDEMPWFMKLLIILLGYSTVVTPAILLIWYARKRYSVIEPHTCFGYWLRAFALGNENYQLVDVSFKKADESRQETKNFMQDFMLLAFLFCGIQGTLVMMGFLQERIITQGYSTIGNEKVEKFGDAQFLVFCNRIVALIICGFVLFINWSRQPPHVQPLYVHSYTSFSNTMSSWCQYEALKYVSFPTQTICKASKVVVTMLMGRILRKQSYSWQEYICGGSIAIGASVFLLSSSGSWFGERSSTSFSGMLLMVGYLIFDAYTLNYQKKLFDKKPKISKYQMMMGVNVFSAILCAVSLAEQGTLFLSIEFALKHNNFFRDVFFLSFFGATGQLFIYSTIEKFGPIVFAVIMTIRQMLSIVLSSLYYGHSLTGWAVVGFAMVFTAIFLDIYRKYFEKIRGN